MAPHLARPRRYGPAGDSLRDLQRSRSTAHYEREPHTIRNTCTATASLAVKLAERPAL